MFNFEKYGNFIKSVYLGGSSANPYIPNPHDKDYIFIVENEKDNKTAQLFKERLDGECFIVRQDGKEYVPCIWAYCLHFSKLLWGIECGEEYDIFEHIDEYKKCLVRNGYMREYTPNRKMWYHILTGIYLLDNGEYELTEEQIANVRLCHDKKMTQEIYDYIQKRLLEYKNELDNKQQKNNQTILS